MLCDGRVRRLHVEVVGYEEVLAEGSVAVLESLLTLLVHAVDVQDKVIGGAGEGGGAAGLTRGEERAQTEGVHHEEGRGSSGRGCTDSGDWRRSVDRIFAREMERGCAAASPTDSWLAVVVVPVQ